MLNFREEKFRDQKANHEIHENIVPRKFGAIRYLEEKGRVDWEWKLIKDKKPTYVRGWMSRQRSSRKKKVVISG